MEEKIPARSHKLLLNDRKRASFSGIKDVLSFDVGEILLETEAGMLMIKGTDLHVKRLTLEKGEVDVEGQVDSLVYSDMQKAEKKGTSFFERMFR
ncbi:MAG: sporulation protein YabP [Eubacterium sp.]|jgi:sporulation protein YabP|nr:sporulation protein YabP [Eubacterium sp.]